MVLKSTSLSRLIQLGYTAGLDGITSLIPARTGFYVISLSDLAAGDIAYFSALPVLMGQKDAWEKAIQSGLTPPAKPLASIAWREIAWELAHMTNTSSLVNLQDPAKPQIGQNGNIVLNGNLSATNIIANNISGQFATSTGLYFGTIPFIRRFGAFPSSPIDGEHFFHTVLKADFEYIAPTGWVQLTTPSFNNLFPVSPLTGFRVFRADRRLEYFFDGTRWLSSQPLFITIPFPAAMALPVIITQAIGRVDNPELVQDIYVESLSVSSVVSVGSSSLYNAANTWQIKLFRIPDNTQLGVTLDVFQASRVLSTRYPNFTFINSQQSIANLVALRLDSIRVGNPGDLNPNPATLKIRLVG